MSALLIGDIKTNPGTRLNESSNSSSANGIFEKNHLLKVNLLLFTIIFKT